MDTDPYEDEPELPPVRRQAGPPRRPPARPSAPQPNFMLLIGMAGGLLLILLLGVVVLLLLPQTNSAGVPGTGPTAVSVGSSGNPATSAPIAPAGNPSPPPAVSISVSISGVVALTITDRNHTTDPITYTQSPPMGGAHWKDWTNCGAYDKPVQNEQAVHSQEHGAVWITYRPDLPADQAQMLRGLIKSGGYLLLSPYPGLPHAIVVSAWGYQLPLERADDPRLPQFIKQYKQDPKGPEPGAPCSGGVGTPMPQP
ncbi:MAG: DUF3105 domain-containing protein [Chloroflexia bacterium]